MNEEKSMHAFGQQLSLDLREVQAHSTLDDSTAEFARVQHAKTLLRELAVALGEQRAMADLEAYRDRMIMPGERE